MCVSIPRQKVCTSHERMEAKSLFEEPIQGKVIFSWIGSEAILLVLLLALSRIMSLLSWEHLRVSHCYDMIKQCHRTESLLGQERPSSLCPGTHVAASEPQDPSERPILELGGVYRVSCFFAKEEASCPRSPIRVSWFSYVAITCALSLVCLQELQILTVRLCLCPAFCFWAGDLYLCCTKRSADLCPSYHA